MPLTVISTDSLLGSLCREGCWLCERASRIRIDLERTNHPALCVRLQREFDALLARREALGELCRQLRASQPWRQSISLTLLEELCSRPLPMARC